MNYHGRWMQQLGKFHVRHCSNEDLSVSNEYDHSDLELQKFKSIMRPMVKSLVKYHRRRYDMLRLSN